MLRDLAKALGATIEDGINWTWATFDSKAAAEKFVKAIEENKREHRGIYVLADTFAVRWR